MAPNAFMLFAQRTRASADWQKNGANLSIPDQGRLLGQLYRSSSKAFRASGVATHQSKQVTYRSEAKKQKTTHATNYSLEPCQVLGQDTWNTVDIDETRRALTGDGEKVFRATDEQERFIRACMAKIRGARVQHDTNLNFSTMEEPLPFHKPPGTVLFITDYSYRNQPKQMALCAGLGAYTWQLKGTGFDFYSLDQ